MSKPDWMIAGTLAHTERQAIVDAVNATNGSITAAARRLKVGRSTLYRLIDKYELSFPRPKLKDQVASKTTPVPRERKATKKDADGSTVKTYILHQDGQYLLRTERITSPQD